jgi:hypothetical protein
MHRVKRPSPAAEAMVVQAVYGLTHVPAWEWPEGARKQLATYLAIGKFDKGEREHVVRGIKKLIDREKRGEAQSGGS